MYIVYMHTCPNGKKYVGITSQAPERRWQKGKGYAYGSNPYFYNAIEKYGWENIKHEILFRDLTKEEAEQKEVELIAKHRTIERKYGYNIDLGGSTFGRHSEEYKRRMSNMQKEIWSKMPERRVAMSKLRSGTHLSEETKEKLRQANLGKKYSKEVVQKRIDKMKGVPRPKTSQIMKDLWASGKMKGNTGKTTSEKQKAAARENAKIANEYSKKPVLMFDKEGNFIAEYESSVKAAEAIGNPHVHVSDVCYGRRKSSCGYVFKFKEV